MIIHNGLVLIVLLLPRVLIYDEMRFMYIFLNEHRGYFNEEIFQFLFDLFLFKNHLLILEQ